MDISEGKEPMEDVWLEFLDEALEDLEMLFQQCDHIMPSFDDALLPTAATSAMEYNGRCDQSQRVASLSRFRQKRKERCFHSKTTSGDNGAMEYPERYSQTERAASLSRFQNKKKERSFGNKVRYSSRQEAALRVHRSKTQIILSKMRDGSNSLGAIPESPQDDIHSEIL
ncbi:CO/COL/TOC1, conserved site [Sesbania bispinosa]|nr:CO/COL/TOC1, conserved site [Sesbania bispinosa]